MPTHEVVKSEIFPLITAQDAQKCEDIQGLMNELNVMDSILYHQIQVIQKRVLSARKRIKKTVGNEA